MSPDVEHKLVDLLTVNIRALVDHEEEVAVEMVTDPETHLEGLEISVNPLDLGKVIGAEGRMAKALRTLVGSVAAKHKVRVFIDILKDSDTLPERDKGKGRIVD